MHVAATKIMFSRTLLRRCNGAHAHHGPSTHLIGSKLILPSNIERNHFLDLNVSAHKPIYVVSLNMNILPKVPYQYLNIYFHPGSALHTPREFASHIGTIALLSPGLQSIISRSTNNQGPQNRHCRETGASSFSLLAPARETS